MRIINLEVNELPPEVLKEYINKNKNSTLHKLKSKSLLTTYKTMALDVAKEKLYPSQTWASFNTGKEFSLHNCYWYSDPLNQNDLIWNQLAAHNKNVGVIGSIHSSKYPADLMNNKYYKFYIPDCFGDKIKTKPTRYINFQRLNASLVEGSSRVTSLNNLLKILFRNLPLMILRSRIFGISKFSLSMIVKIIYKSIISKNKELLRTAQFAPLSSIFIDLYLKSKPNSSTLFTNHLAGNMHRYWYAYKPEQFNTKDKYSTSWVSKNQNTFNLSLDLIDDFIKHLMNNISMEETSIIITSSMGQEANPEFDKRYFSQYDGKIENMNLFLQGLNKFYKKSNYKEIDYIYERNMAPQYGFKLNTLNQGNLQMGLERMKHYVSHIGLKSKFDLIENDSFTMTLDPYSDIDLQKSYTLDQANNKYKSLGISFHKINDHHSGSHTPEGVFTVINGSDKFHSLIQEKLDKDGNLDYLKFKPIVLKYLT